MPCNAKECLGMPRKTKQYQMISKWFYDWVCILVEIAFLIFRNLWSSLTLLMGNCLRMLFDLNHLHAELLNVWCFLLLWCQNIVNLYSQVCESVSKWFALPILWPHNWFLSFESNSIDTRHVSRIWKHMFPWNVD